MRIRQHLLYVQANRNQHSITRDYSENNIDTFRTHLTNLDWSNYSDNDPNIIYNNFLNDFLRIYDLSFPAMVVKRKIQTANAMDD